MEGVRGRGPPSSPQGGASGCGREGQADVAHLRYIMPMPLEFVKIKTGSAVMSGVLEALLLPVPPGRRDPSKNVFKRTCVGMRTLQSLCYDVGADSILLSGFMCSGHKNMVRWAVT